MPFIFICPRSGCKWNPQSCICVTLAESEFTQWSNPSGRSTALGLTQLLTELSTRRISYGGKGGQSIGLTTISPLCANFLEILGASTSWSPKGLSRLVNGLIKNNLT
jgi:hypothetical protein